MRLQPAYRARTVGLLTAALLPLKAHGGPPFLTDDPAPVDYQHWEF